MERTEGIRGWCNPLQKVILERLAENQVVMEIGCFEGLTTVVMAPGAKKIICIDFFWMGDPPYEEDLPGRLVLGKQKPKTRQVFERNIAPWREKIEIHEMYSQHAVKLEWEPLGLLYVDGGHDYDTVTSDLGFLKWVVVGGNAAFHDSETRAYGVQRALADFFPDNPEWEMMPATHNLAVYRRILPPRELEGTE